MQSFPRSFSSVKKVSVPEYIELHLSNSVVAGVLYLIGFDYSSSDRYRRELKLHEFKPFPWLDYFDPKMFARENIDVLVHLRLGDSFIYKTRDDRYFDARLKKFVEVDELDQLRIWSPNSIQALIDILRECHLNLRIISDGIGSGLRLLRWGSWVSENDAEIILESMEAFWSELCVFLESNNLRLEINDLKVDVGLILSSKLLVYTDGSFLRAINNNLNSCPRKMFHLKDFGEIKSFILANW